MLCPYYTSCRRGGKLQGVTLLDALTSGRPLLMDGAMGTELLRAGLPLGAPGEAWNLQRPDVVRSVHQSYVAAGAAVLLTNTFQSHPAALARQGLEARLEEVNAAALRLARAARGRFVLADVGPSAGPKELGDRKALGRVLESLEGADGYLFETCSSPTALEAVQWAFHRSAAADVPILLSLTYLRSRGKLVTLSGHGPETYARHAERHGVAALGVNCGRGVGPADVVEIVRRYRGETGLPLFARPNAGTPVQTEGGWEYPLGPEELASYVPALLEAGATMIGGCCGTTPAHIAALSKALS
jgi:5-methyltetrahydrofolate--homocysteine methyltransferase